MNMGASPLAACSCASLLAIYLALMAVPSAAQTQPAQPADEGPAQVSASAEKPRVFITSSESWAVEGAAAASNGSYSSQMAGGARPQTAEIIKTFQQRCPDVIVNNRQELAEYIVVLEHEGGKGYLRHKDKVAVFEHASGDLVMSHSTLSVGGSVEDACKGITQHWAAHGQELLIAEQKASAPPAQPSLAAQTSMPPQPQASGSASVEVDSTPPGADIAVDGGFVGNTPSTVTIAPGKHEITVSKKGFADWTRTLNVTGGTVHLSATLDPAAQSAPPQPASSPQ